MNTGWNSTASASPSRIPWHHRCDLDGSIKNSPTKTIPYFNFEVPTELPGVDPKILDPRDTYADPADWDAKAKDLASRFQKNFAKYESNAHGKSLWLPARSCKQIHSNPLCQNAKRATRYKPGPLSSKMQDRILFLHFCLLRAT